jgi:general secretion pathway protein I
MSRPCVYKCSAKGFTLIEVLVALVILSLSLAIIFAGFSTSLRSKRVAEDHQQATLLAESKLNSVGVERPLQEGVTVGRFDDRFRWKVEVAPYHEEEMDQTQDLEKLPLVPLVVTVTVSWGDPGDERSVSLTTLRLEAP